MKRYSTVARTLLGAIGVTTLLSMSACGYLAAEPNQGGTYAESPRSQEAAAEEASREGEFTTTDAAESAVTSGVSPQSTASLPLAAGGTNIPNDQPYDLMYFASEGVNPFVDAEDDHFSTFAMDVDTASYTVARRYLNDGYLPPEDAIRVEEFINYFDLNYPGPENENDAFAIHLEGAPAPFGPTNAYLLKVGLQGKEVAVEDRKPANLVFVIDISGSMAQENRLGLVKRSLQLLVDELRPTDTVGIVVYGSTARALLNPTSPEDRDYILQAIDQLEPDGSTNAEEGLRLGYEMAANAFQLGGINRVILLSDGVANVGNTGPDSILQTIDRYVDEGITLSTVGFGMGNYNDILMEQLANDGNGNYAYVDTLDEARRIFVENLTGTLQVIAKDAKIQVDFNPEVVRSYRLLGYENRDVADQDFRNDEVDAGEVGAGHSVTALYEIKLHDSVQASEEALALTTYIRYQDLDQGEIVEVAAPFNVGDFRTSLDETSDGFRLIAAVAEYAEILRGSYWAKEGDLGEVERLALSAEDSFAEDSEVLEFFNLLEQAGQLVEPDPQP